MCIFKWFFEDSEKRAFLPKRVLPPMGYPVSGKGYHLWDDENFVDLGLPSKTLWGICDDSEMISLTDAIRVGYGPFLPTKEQVQELISECLWIFDEEKNGFTVSGKNGNNIFLPLMDGVFGFYHTSSMIDDKHHWAFSIDEIHKGELFPSLINSGAFVRLVYKINS